MYSIGVCPERDLKPANVIVVPNDPDGTFLKAIEIGSSCDCGSLVKQALRLATCDPSYTAPERKFDVFKPALRVDVYSIGQIALRVTLPRLMENSAMNVFVEKCLGGSRFDFERACTAITSGRIDLGPAIAADIDCVCV